MIRVCEHDEGFLLEYSRAETAREDPAAGRPTARIGPETSTRVRTGFLDVHCCSYVTARDALIPEAAAWVDQALGSLPQTREAEVEWNLEFLAEMDRLVLARGVRSVFCTCYGCLNRRQRRS